jgi:hypothetical protein
LATKLAARIQKVAGAADVRIQQIMDQPTLQTTPGMAVMLRLDRPQQVKVVQATRCYELSESSKQSQ